MSAAPSPRRRLARLLLLLLLTGLPLAPTRIGVSPALAAEPTAPDPSAEARAWALSHAESIPTGVLLDVVAPLSGIERFDGSPAAAAASVADWFQAFGEWQQASLRPVAHPSLATLRATARAEARGGLLPLALLDVRYDRLANAEDLRSPLQTVTHRAVVAACLAEHVYAGRELTFVLSPDRFFTVSDDPIRTMTVDLDDGLGPRSLSLGSPLRTRYQAPGAKAIRLLAETAGGKRLSAAAAFRVLADPPPVPDDTLLVTASVPYQAVAGTGRAFVSLAPGHAQIENPIVVVEGFDLENDMNWDELYVLLNQEGLLDSLQQRGYDAVVLDFTDATDYIQRNSFVVVELIQKVEALIDPSRTIAVVGASMGALCSRYALAYLEGQGIGHRVRTWLSFDGPHGGANVPLGLQYWVQFFSDLSAAAADFRDLLNRPAARQMLAYHFTNPPSSTPSPDPLRAALLADFTTLGEYPSQPRRVAVANGSGTGVDQGYAAGAQVIEYAYSDALVGIRGHVWALPDHVSGTIFDGYIRILIFPQTQVVTVSGTWPIDSAPGGWRGSMAQLDSTVAPYGDIVAVHDNHAFVPTVSALALPTDDPFYDVAGDLDLLAHTPFDAVLYPEPNEEHVEISPTTAAWIVQELDDTVVGVPLAGSRHGGLALAPPAPNPVVGSARLRFTTPQAGPVRLTLYDVTGRRVCTLWDGTLPAGSHVASWDGRLRDGRVATAGIYFVRLRASGETRNTHFVKIR